jgi:pyruvate dehydrogenase E2 component (dihydrolipoyllysine-residue acetyltransferase)
MAEFRMPQLGADMAAGTLVEWLKQPGDQVRRGDIVAVVETDKGAIEVEIFETGVLDELRVAPGTKVPVGTVLATLKGEGEAGASTSEAAAPPQAPSAPVVPPAPPVTPRHAPRRSTGRVRISPAAARLALERGVDIGTLAGTGPGGAIRIADVEAAAEAATRAAGPAPVPGTGEPATPAEAMRRAIAAAMGRSKREIPHYYLATTIDMGAALQWLARANEERTVAGRLLYGVLLLKAVALALREYPEFAGFWRDDRFEAAAGIHIGTAVALRGGGLVAPAIHDVDRLSLDELMAALRALVARARAFRLRSSEISDPAITVTSLGEQGVDEVFGVIYPPQVALVGFGRPAARPWVVEPGVIGTRQLLRASLSADHRASDGHRGARFLAAIERLLQEPEKL